MHSVTVNTLLKRIIPRPVKNSLKKLFGIVDVCAARSRLLVGVQPLSDNWGRRGKIIHRYYLEEFLQRFASDIRGRCLEFQEDSYSTRFGGDKVHIVDIINMEPDRRGTTIVADLTKDNDIPSNYFDCVICTYVLHIIYDKERVISEMHRILKPGGTLLIGVPNITIHYPQFPELWRFTKDGLRTILAKYFRETNLTVEGYGNSLTAAGELRGLVCGDFFKSELDYHDPRYALIVCARAVKE